MNGNKENPGAGGAGADGGPERRELPQRRPVVNITVPRHEPEVVAAEASKRWGSDEKVSDTSINGAAFLGVTITSRYGKASEVELMRAMVLALPPDERALVKEIFCDSQFGDSFTITLRRPVRRRRARRIGGRVEAMCFAIQGGHNGVDVDGVEVCGGWDEVTR
jgi:hypothetical protein